MSKISLNTLTNEEMIKILQLAQRRIRSCIYVFLAHKEVEVINRYLHWTKFVSMSMDKKQLHCF